MPWGGTNLKVKEVFNKRVNGSSAAKNISVTVRAGKTYYFMYHGMVNYETTVSIDGANLLIKNESDASQAALIKAIGGVFVATKDTVKFDASTSISWADLYVYEIS